MDENKDTIDVRLEVGGQCYDVDAVLGAELVDLYNYNDYSFQEEEASEDRPWPRVRYVPRDGAAPVAIRGIFTLRFPRNLIPSFCSDAVRGRLHFSEETVVGEITCRKSCTDSEEVTFEVVGITDEWIKREKLVEMVGVSK